MNNIKGISAYREVFFDGQRMSAEPSKEVINHSPDGFNWGYGGSGPSQLALAILMKVTDKDTALALHQAFKWNFVAKWPQNENFDVNIDIAEWLRTHKE